MSKRKKIIITVASVVVVLLLAAGIYVYSVYNTAKVLVGDSYHPASIKKYRNTSQVLAEGKPVSILLLGTDTGSLNRHYKGRTDSMIVVTMNPTKKTTTMVSIPRDTWVNVPGYQANGALKINAAYAYGSAGTAIKTVEKMLNVPIDFYVLLNMGGLKHVIDEVGGIDVRSTLTFNYEDAHFENGVKQHMDGATALKFSRMRYTDPRGDYGRQERQRRVIQGLVRKLTAQKNPFNMKLYKTLGKQTVTDLQLGDMQEIAKNYREADDQVKSDHLQGEGAMVRGQSVQIMHQDELQRITNLVRTNLELKTAKTGHIQAGR